MEYARVASVYLRLCGEISLMNPHWIVYLLVIIAVLGGWMLFFGIMAAHPYKIKR
jgi:hypothetical protein